MILSDLFTIINTSHDDNTIRAEIRLDINHPVFKGHFPDKAVMPGVCLVEIVRSITSITLNKKLRIKQAKNIKFTAVLDPAKNDSALVDISYTIIQKTIDINCTVSGNDTIFLKYKGQFHEE